MFDKDKAFYANEDYTVRMEKIGGCEKYYLKFHAKTDSPEQEITLDVFMLYYYEFRKPLDKKRNEYRRHIADGEIDGFVISGKLRISQFEQEFADKAELQAALKTCTPVQQRRFELYYVHGYTFMEIAQKENCDYTSVKESVNAVKEKIKKYFLSTP